MSDKRGYLNEAFRLFHLRDSLGGGGAFHYHDFDKLVFFVSGKVDYMVDGETYALRAGDVLLVRRCALHRAEIDVSEPYERIIVYIDRLFGEKYGTDKTPLLRCFEMSEKCGCLIRPDALHRAELHSRVMRIENAASSGDFGADVLSGAALAELLVYINRLKLSSAQNTHDCGQKSERIAETLRYISENLTADLSVGALAERCFFSRYYFMRLFREETGYTVHSYVREKRLLNAARLITRGNAAYKAAEMSGFCDYSAFERAFRQKIGASPSDFRGAGISDTPERE